MHSARQRANSSITLLLMSVQVYKGQVSVNKSKGFSNLQSTNETFCALW